MQNFDHNIGFWEKRQFFRRKLSKIAENCDHNIDPRALGFHVALARAMAALEMTPRKNEKEQLDSSSFVCVATSRPRIQPERPLSDGQQVFQKKKKFRIFLTLEKNQYVSPAERRYRAWGKCYGLHFRLFWQIFGDKRAIFLDNQSWDQFLT
jgi:hypothetical protein